MVRKVLCSVAYFTGFVAYGQLQNGSFESNGTAWVDSCAWAEYIPGGHTGGGNIQVRMPLYSEDVSCSPVTAGMIYQELPFVQDGDVVEIQGWARGVANDPSDQDQVACRGALWQVNNGAYAGGLQTGFGTQLSDTVWMPFAGACTYALAPNDVAVVMIGGYGFFQTQGLIYIDEMVLTVNGSTGLTVISSAAQLQYDATRAVVRVTAQEGNEGWLELWDHMGRRVATRSVVDGSTAEMGVALLSAGPYLVRFTSSIGSSLLRFVK